MLASGRRCSKGVSFVMSDTGWLVVPGVVALSRRKRKAVSSQATRNAGTSALRPSLLQDKSFATL